MIGTLTFQNTINFGAMLQTYALCKKINDLGNDCEVINYINCNIVANEYPLTINDITTFRKALYFIFTNKYKKQQYDAFQRFYKKYIPSSKIIYTQDNKDQIEENYSKIIVGSDQVWNLHITKNDYTYFLDCIRDSKKKNTYAASFGYSELPYDHEKQAQLLNDFASINVRESSAAKLVNRLTGRSANVVLDPTLLLSNNEWSSIVTNEYEFQLRKEYIFVYLIDRSPEVIDIIKTYAKSHGYKVIMLHNYLKSISGFVNIRAASPEQFIDLVRKAKCIFTGSFHAICFSIIYNKDFFYTKSGNNANSRLTDLLTWLHIDNRSLCKQNVMSESTIDYGIINKQLEQEREKSIQLLESIIKEKL